MAASARSAEIASSGTAGHAWKLPKRRCTSRANAAVPCVVSVNRATLQATDCWAIAGMRSDGRTHILPVQGSSMRTLTTCGTEEAQMLRTPPYRDADARWAAVQQRDRRADGSFVYAVETTGIFCRPSCASRVPHRRNVEFFEQIGHAEQSGYRPCKRCRPTAADDPRAKLERTLVRACRLLERDGGRPRSHEVAADVGLSSYYFQRSFKKHLGVSPQEYRRRVVAERAKTDLVEANSVTDAIYNAGYSSSSRFYDGPARELGMTARQARSGARDQTVRYAVRSCSLGRLLVAWTARGVCDVRFAHSDDEAVRGLSKRFPAASLARAQLPSWVDAVAELVERPDAPTEIPLDVRGTAFQERVWRELRLIRVGETKSYSEVARDIGAPTASRAVARACATNGLAVVVPCHRVVRSDGAVSGYRWGVDRKKELLQREARTRRPPR
jgi:AraC family transcriptional regulator of adaptative response/methylated-DNA-[protein]-cysteine methyltransferase